LLANSFAILSSRLFLKKNSSLWPSEDHVWFEDRWMVASLCDE
jgi:hypothetical protein